jgi:DNA invertase Pin-like site-specific DNA recombinase
MATIGYARVSDETQDATTQINTLNAHEYMRVFADHGVSSGTADRPEWIACRDCLRTGDVLVVCRLNQCFWHTGCWISQ